MAEDSVWEPLPEDQGRVWTDDFSNVVAAIQWYFSWDWLRPSEWWAPEKYSEASFHSSVGNILCSQGRFAEGIAHFQKALDIAPDYAEVHYNWGLVLAFCGQTDKAIARFQRAVEINPDYAEAHFNLAKALANRGRLDEAMIHYQKVLTIQPSGAAHNNFGLALAAQGRRNEASIHYQIALKINPNDLEVQRNLAWLRATCPEASLRNSAQALELAQRADRLSGGKRPDVLDALAAAYAAAGRFPEALATARQALQLAEQQNNQRLAGTLRARLALYEAGKPYRETPPASAPSPPKRF